MIHEFSHFSDVVGTDDYAYGTDECLALAKSDTESALMNGDSHEYFIEDQME